jgi:uncharacterized protein YggU (UPF0235/DUF167 family)
LTEPPAKPEGLPGRPVPGGIMLQLRVTPKSSSDAVLGVEARTGGAVLKVAVRALPDKGAANVAVVATLAKWLSEPKTKLRVASGDKARLKQVFVAGEPVELMAKLAALLSGKG